MSHVSLNIGLRRIPLQKLWDESTQSVSFDHLTAIILQYKNIPPKAIQNERVNVTTTYKDEDGDEITISSNSELLDAFEQFTDSQPPVLRAKAVVIKKNAVSTSGPLPTKKEIRQEIKAKKDLLKVVKKEMQQKKKINKTHNNNGEKNLNGHDDLTLAVPSVVPVVKLPSVAPPKTIAETINAAPPKEDPTNAFGCDPDFIHGRHTCDGCLTTPIFGLRYHAMNVPDYDLCSKCHGNYAGTDIEFKPLQLDRDSHLQVRWQRRHGMRRPCRPMIRVYGSGIGGRSNRTPSIPEVASGTQTKKVIDGMDDALKEAIRRSLVDAWPVKETEKVKDTDEVSADIETQGTKNEKEEDDVPVIPVATVVGIEAGNEETQKTLDNMDPKIKEALRKKLNAFFARRVNGSKTNHEKDDSTFSPTEETQKKIDAMDPDAKEAIRRSLNDFFANRRALKEENLVVESSEGDNLERTKEILASMNEETKVAIRKSLHDFFARRAQKNNDAADCAEDSDKAKVIPSVVVDILVDDDLSVASDDLDIDAEVGIGGSEDDVDTSDENNSSICEGSTTKDEWQMVSEHDEMIAVAAQMLGSALFESDGNIKHDSKDVEKENATTG